MTKSLFSSPVSEYYDAKTSSLLERYGPGPRVHYHCGLVGAPPSKETPD